MYVNGLKYKKLKKTGDSSYELTADGSDLSEDEWDEFWKKSKSKTLWPQVYFDKPMYKKRRGAWVKDAKVVKSGGRLIMCTFEIQEIPSGFKIDEVYFTNSNLCVYFCKDDQ